VEQVERDYLAVQSGNVRTHMRACRNLVLECVIDPRVLKYAIDFQLSAVTDRAYTSQRLHDVMKEHLGDLGAAVAYTVYMRTGLTSITTSLRPPWAWVGSAGRWGRTTATR
jgi:hypothetical protein